jgi:chromosome partitioning protein
MPDEATADVSRETAANQNGSSSYYPAIHENEEPGAELQQRNMVSPGGVSRETLNGDAVYEALQADLANESGGLGRGGVSRETSFDTPIAREAMQAVHTRNVRQEVWPRPTDRRVMTIANQKGGVGKTTTAVNIAMALAQHGLRVLMIDLDPQGNASTALSVDHAVGTPSIYDVLMGSSTLDEVAVQVQVAPSRS